jgi:hypothetical protein
MSGEKISLELLGTRVLTLTDRVHGLELEIRDLKIRFTAIEARMNPMLPILVRLAERQGLPPTTRD